jgi:alcohol dehydrogenase
MDQERRCYRIPKAGSLKNLKLITEKLDAPAANEVTVAVKVIGLNYADLFAVMGLYSATPKGSFVPGLEYAGEIIALGKDVKNIKLGDKVMGVTRFGAYTSHLNIDAQYVIPLPQGWSYEQGAAFPVQVLTAYYALVTLGNLQKGQTVLIHSAAGGVGLLANRIAKRLGAFTIGVVGHESKISKLKTEGYDQAIVRSSSFKKELEKSLQGRELNLVLETTGGKYFKWSYEMLAKQGRLIAYGSAQFTPSGSRPNYIKLVAQFLFRPRVFPLQMIIDNKSVMGFNLIWLYEKAGMMDELMKEINKLNIEPPFVGHTFEFEKLSDALKLFQSGTTMGKVVVRV